MPVLFHTNSKPQPPLSADANALLALDAAPAAGQLKGSSMDKGCEGGCAECATGGGCGSGAIWDWLNAAQAPE